MTDCEKKLNIFFSFVSFSHMFFTRNCWFRGGGGWITFTTYLLPLLFLLSIVWGKREPLSHTAATTKGAYKSSPLPTNKAGMFGNENMHATNGKIIFTSQLLLSVFFTKCAVLLFFWRGEEISILLA